MKQHGFLNDERRLTHKHIEYCGHKIRGSSSHFVMACLDVSDYIKVVHAGLDFGMVRCTAMELAELYMAPVFTHKIRITLYQAATLSTAWTDPYPLSP